MDPDIKKNRILRVPLIALSWLGMVNFNDQTLVRFNHLKGYTVVVIYILYDISFAIFLYQHRDDMTLITINGGTLALYITIFIKGLCSLMYQNKFCEMYTSMHKNMKRIETSGDEGSKRILEEHVRKCLKITWGLQIALIITGVFFAGYLTAIFFVFHEPGEPIHPFCVDTWFPYDVEDHLILTFCIYTLLAIFDVLLIPQWNSMVISMLVYARCMLKILQYKMRNRDTFMNESKGEELFGKITEEERYRYVIACIKEHLAIIKFLDNLKEIISFPMGIDFLNFALILCGQAFIGSKMSFGFELVFSWAYFIDIMFLALLYYWYASQTYLQGQELAMAVYESSWTDDNTSCRHAALLMIQRSHRSVTLKAGILPMNLGTYIMMLRASYSAFTILRQINN